MFQGLKDQPHNTVDGVNYGIPHGRGANLLMYTRTSSSRRRTLAASGGDESQPYKGKITAYDSPIYIADAALYLKATQPDLGIDNVYELDDKQFQGIRRSAQAAARLIGEYWSDYTKEQSAFTSGDSVAGTTWQMIANLRLRATRSHPGRGDPAEGGLNRVVGHLDDLLRGQAPELHVQVDGPHHQPAGRTPTWPSGSGRPRQTASPAP